MLQEIMALFRCCRTVWGHYTTRSLHHLATEWSYTISIYTAEGRGTQCNSELNPMFPFVKSSRKILFFIMQKSSSCTEVLHLPLVINFPFCPIALIDDRCLLNTLLPNRQQRSCSNRYMVEGTNTAGRWAHIFLGKGLNPVHARILTSQQRCLWQYFWNGLRILHNKQERQP